MPKKILAALLALAMCASLLCAGVLADGETAEGESGAELTAEEPVGITPQAEGDVAQIGDATYATLDDAIEAAQDGTEIVLLGDCEITKPFDKELVFKGNGTVSINKQISSQGTGFFILTKSLIFDGSGVALNWNSDGSSTWLILSLSGGKINAINGAKITFQFNSNDTASRNAIYMAGNAEINVSNGSTFQILGYETAGTTGQGVQLDSPGAGKITVKDNSTFLIDGTNRGYVSSPTIYVEDSEFIIRNCTSNASNGGKFTAVRSNITFEDNAGHGLSAGELTIEDSTLNCNRNAYYGITYSTSMTADGTSKIYANGNGTGYTGGGMCAANSSVLSRVESGAIVEINDNSRNGLENYGNFTFEDGVNLEIVGNNERDTNGGGIFNAGTLTLPENAVITNNRAKQTGGGICNAGMITMPDSVQIYNNHADNSGDDIYNRDSATITFPKTNPNWYLDGEPDCNHRIDGWYDDSEDARWEAHGETLEYNHIYEFNEFSPDTGLATVSGLAALKAAHGIMPVTITPADITIYMGGDDGYEGVVGGTQMGSDSLPPPLFYVDLPEGVTADVTDMVMYGDEDRVWKFVHVGEDEDGVPLYYIESTGSDTQDPVRVTYTDTDGGAPIISDAFDPATVGEVFNDYTIAVYRDNSGEVSVDIDGVRYAVETGTGRLRVRAVEDNEGGENPVVGVTAEVSEPVGAGKAAITAPEDTEYTLNNTTVKVEAAGVGLLFDGIIDTDVNRTNALVERAEDVLGGSFGNRYQAQYLDLVDADNGNAWVKANNKVTVYWGYPEGTGRYTDFTLLHFENLHRDNASGGLSGFEVDDVDDCIVTEVEISRTANGIAFDVKSGGFSPFLLVWNVKTDPGPGPGPGPDPEPDEPSWPVVRPDEPEGLNTEDHVAYIIGYPDGGVHPTGDITRAEVATIFFRLLTDEARDEYWSSESGFTDVETGDWFNNAVSTLAKMGILGGYEDGSFRPNAPITRAEFTKIAVSFFEKASEIAYDGRFTDIAGSEWYADAVAGAAYYGLIDGYEDGTFRPGANITRAEACTIVNRVFGRAPHEDHLLPAGEMLTWPDNKPGAWYYADMQEATNSHDYEWAGEIENWLEKLPERDWDALEREWSDAHSAPGGEVMG